MARSKKPPKSQKLEEFTFTRPLTVRQLKSMNKKAVEYLIFNAADKKQITQVNRDFKRLIHLRETGNKRKANLTRLSNLIRSDFINRLHQGGIVFNADVSKFQIKTYKQTLRKSLLGGEGSLPFTQKFLKKLKDAGLLNKRFTPKSISRNKYNRKGNIDYIPNESMETFHQIVESMGGFETAIRLYEHRIVELMRKYNISTEDYFAFLQY